MSPATPKGLVVETCRRLDELGLIAGAEGNVSVRLDDGNILITPSGMAKGMVTEDDLLVIAPAAQADDPRAPRPASRAPSSEYRMHLRIYARRPEIRAVVHAHPPLATAFAVAGEDFMAPVLPEIILQMGGVPLVPYATPGTDALGDALEPYLSRHEAFLLANHGATTIGHSLAGALHRMESLEQAARTIMGARLLGRVNPLTADQVLALLASSRH